MTMTASGPPTAQESSKSGPDARSSPEVPPKATEATNGTAKSHTALQGETGRSCSECGGALPASQAAAPSALPVRPGAPSSVTTVSATTVSGTRKRAPR